MEIEIVCILTGYHEDASSDTDLIVLTDNETEARLVEIMAELYLDEAETPLPADPTWEWLENQIADAVWWRVERRTITV